MSTIKVGRYTLEQDEPHHPHEHEAKLWLMGEGGEGMEVNEEQLEEWLAKFYAEHF